MNQILYAVLSNVSAANLDLSRIAAKAFSRAAPFTRRNFEVQEQKEYIMNAIFGAIQLNDEEILESFMEALVDIGKVAYDYMAPYIQTIGEITLNFINSDMDKATTLAIEFWTSLCEVENERNQKKQPH
jgi:importin subunit beta-1